MEESTSDTLQTRPETNPNPYSNKRSNGGSQSSFRGVRRRSWGRYVSEIRLPGKNVRVWLGSFVSAEMAARAYDTAAFFLRGDSATLNFPEVASSLPRPDSASRKDIQRAAAKAATTMNFAGHVPERDEAQPDTVSRPGAFWELDEEIFSFLNDDEEAPLLSPLRFDGGNGFPPLFDAEIYDCAIGDGNVGLDACRVGDGMWSNSGTWGHVL